MFNTCFKVHLRFSSPDDVDFDRLRRRFQQAGEDRRIRRLTTKTIPSKASERMRRRRTRPRRIRPRVAAKPKPTMKSRPPATIKGVVAPDGTPPKMGKFAVGDESCKNHRESGGQAPIEREDVVS